MTDYNALRSEMREMIYATPQASMLEDHHVQNWIDRVIDIDPERALWHCKRLGGFGGSEVGPMVSSLRGDVSAFTSAYEICAGKLCILPPSRGDEHTNRGNVMEPIIKGFFEEKLKGMGIEFRELDDVQKHEIEDVNNPMYTWMRSSLDGLYEVTLPSGVVEIWQPDFKAPSEKVLETYRKSAAAIKEATGVDSDYGFQIPDRDMREGCDYTKKPEFNDYIHQLHHYKTDAELKGVSVDRMIIVAFDYSRANVEMFFIDHDPSVVSDIVDASEHYWGNYILQGKMPPKEGREVLEADDLDEMVKSDIEDYLRIKLAAKKLGQKEAELRANIEMSLSALGDLGDGVLHHGGADIKSKTVLDEDAILMRFKELGISTEEVDALRKPGTYDTTKMKKVWHSVSGALTVFMDSLSSKDKQGIQSSLTILKEALHSMPQKNKGAFDEKKLRAKLLSCGVDANCFIKEELSIGETRRKSTELDLLHEEISGNLMLIEEILQLNHNVNNSALAPHM